MAYNALITVDIPNAVESEKVVFYETLKKEKWTKLKNLDTAWVVAFRESVIYSDAENTLIAVIEKAKKNSCISEAYYTFLFGA